MRISVLEHNNVRKCRYAVTLINVLLLVTQSFTMLRARAAAVSIRNESVFQCQYIAGLFVEQGGRNCAPYDCWHSQLLDLSRDTLIKIFNDYKAAIAQKKCDRCAYPRVPEFAPVFHMYYHWVLEWTALHYQRARNKNCEFQQRLTITKNDLPPEVYSSEHSLGSFREVDRTEMEYSSISFKLDTNGDQTAAIEQFKKLMFNDRKYNLFEAWNGTNYRYTMATSFGCALTIRNNVTGKTSINETVIRGRVAYLACVFTFEPAQNDRSNNNSKNCTQYHAVFDPRTKLCDYARFEENMADDIPCQFYYHTSKRAMFLKCIRQEPPRVWLQNEAPDPRQRKILIKMGNSAIVEVAAASGQTQIKSLQREESRNILKMSDKRNKNRNSTLADYVVEENESKSESDDDEEEQVGDSDFLVEYERIDEFTTHVPEESMKMIFSVEMMTPLRDATDSPSVFSTVSNKTALTRGRVHSGRILAMLPTEGIADSIRDVDEQGSRLRWYFSSRVPPTVGSRLTPGTQTNTSAMLDAWRREGSRLDFLDQTSERMGEEIPAITIGNESLDEASKPNPGSDGACSLQKSKLIFWGTIYFNYVYALQFNFHSR